jgi:hypothetical protein
VTQWLRNRQIEALADGKIDADAAHARLDATLDKTKGMRRKGNVTSRAPSADSARQAVAPGAGPTERPVNDAGPTADNGAPVLDANVNGILDDASGVSGAPADSGSAPLPAQSAQGSTAAATAPPGKTSEPRTERVDTTNPIFAGATGPWDVEDRYNAFWNRLNDSWERHPPGERVVVNLEGEFAGRRWYDVEVPWTRETAFAIESIGVRLDRALQSHMNLGSGDIGILIDQIRLDSGETDAVVASELFEAGSGNWRACFTWFDRARQLESGPSPYSQPFKGNGGAMRIDVSGWFPGIQEGLQNATSQRGIDAVHISLANELWGPDPQTGGFMWRRVTPKEGLALADLEKGNTASVVTPAGTGDGTLEDIYIRRGCPAGTIVVTFSSATDFTVAFSGATDETPTAGVVGTPYQNQYFGFTAVAGGTAWVNTDTRTFQVSATENFANSRLYATISNPTDEALLLSTGEPAPWTNWRLPNGEIALAVGRRVVVARQPGIEFTATFTDGSSLVNGFSDVAILGEWMEGRRLRVAGEDRVYVILKVVDADSDGEFGSLWIVSDRALDKATTDEAESAGGYDGETGAKLAEILPENDKLWWSNVTARPVNRKQVNVVAASPLNVFDVPGSGFNCGGLAWVGQFLWMIDRWGRGAYVFRPLDDAYDDLNPGAAFSSPVFYPDISCIARRSVVSIAPNRALWLGARGEIWQAEQNAAAPHPASAQLRGLLEARGALLSSVAMERAVGRLVRIGAERAAFWSLPASAFAMDGATRLSATGEVGVASKTADARAVDEPATVEFEWPPTDTELATGVNENRFWNRTAANSEDDGEEMPMHEFPFASPRLVYAVGDADTGIDDETLAAFRDEWGVRSWSFPVLGTSAIVNEQTCASNEEYTDREDTSGLSTGRLR